MQNRKLLFLIILVTLFSVASLVWYFFFTTPASAPSLAQSGNSFIKNILPQSGFIFGNSTDTTQSTSTTEIIPENEQPLIKIWNAPTTGNTFFPKEYFTEQEVPITMNGTTTLQRKTVRATTTVLIFVDRTTGYVYGYNMQSGATYQISNTTLPGIYDAYIFDNGSRIILRYIDTDKTTVISVLATLPQVTEGRDAQPLQNTAFLPNNVGSIAVSNDYKKVSYVVQNQTGATIYTINGTNTLLVTTSPFSEWTLSYGGNQLYGTTKASAYIEGTTVQLPSFGYITGKMTGLTTSLSPDTSFISSMWSRTGLQTLVADPTTHTLKNTSIKTLSAKCISKVSSLFFCAVPQTLPNSTEGLPDDWYQGTVSFKDSLVIVDAKNAEVYPLYSFDDSVGAMDITHLAVSDDARLISFIQKQTGTLWLLIPDRIVNE